MSLSKEYYEPLTCDLCASGAAMDDEIRFAFQPIVDARDGSVFAYEALVRGAQGESAQEVFAKLSPRDVYRFDQSCRVIAVKTAAALGMSTRLSINFNPNSVYKASLCIRTTLAAAARFGFPVEQMIFEATESEEVSDRAHLTEVLSEYERLGFTTAIDDFGAGYAGLNLLVDFQPDFLKLDRKLVDHIDEDPVRQAILKGIIAVARELGVELIAEGVERVDEFEYLKDQSLHLFQGYYFARPQLESLVVPDMALFR